MTKERVNYYTGFPPENPNLALRARNAERRRKKIGDEIAFREAVHGLVTALGFKDAAEDTAAVARAFNDLARKVRAERRAKRVSYKGLGKKLAEKVLGQAASRGESENEFRERLRKHVERAGRKKVKPTQLPKGPALDALNDSSASAASRN